MKILIINTVRFKLNGISEVIKNYYNAMEKDDLRMDFVAIDNPILEYLDFFKKENLQCFVIYKNNLFKYFFELVLVARNGHYDIAHVHGNSANMAVELLACYCAGIKVRIAHSHNTSSLHPVMHKLLFPLFTSLCTQRFACGQDAGKWLFHRRKFEVIKNGIDLNKYFYNPKVREEYRNLLYVGERTVIGHVGNFVEQKNHTFLLDLFKVLLKNNPNYVLVLVSDGHLMMPMKEKAKELGIEENVRFVGKTLYVEKYLQAMDIFILPSLYEGLPVVLVEAQASGLPCFVSDTVAREVNFIGGIEFLTIEDMAVWVKAIENSTKESASFNRKKSCMDCQALLKDAGYDINSSAEGLKMLYLQAVQQK